LQRRGFIFSLYRPDGQEKCRGEREKYKKIA
jgi:hypothetical protein